MSWLQYSADITTEFEQYLIFSPTKIMPYRVFTKVPESTCMILREVQNLVLVENAQNNAGISMMRDFIYQINQIITIYKIACKGKKPRKAHFAIL